MSWLLKDLSNKISNIQLDDLYNHAIDSGASGGKLFELRWWLYFMLKKKYKKF